MTEEELRPPPMADELNKPPRTRSRRGCLTCRRRRLKCNERTPICANCTSMQCKCVWGIKASFHMSRMRGLSYEEATEMREIELSRTNQHSLEFVDKTSEIMSDYVELDPDSRTEMNVEDMEAYSEEEVSVCGSYDIAEQQKFSPTKPRTVYTALLTNVHQHLPSEFMSGNADDISSAGSALIRSGDFASEISPPATFTLTSNLGDSPMTFSSAASRQFPSWPIDEVMKAKLMLAYLDETSTWCETTDSLRQFSIKNARSLIDSQSFGASALALASRQRNITTDHPASISEDLYDFARKTICSLEAWQNDHIVLASTVLLCVYCMMTSEVAEWRLHLGGCAGTFKEKGWNGSSPGLPAACFWAFARIDIWASYLVGETTLIPTDTWIQPDYMESEGAPVDDILANVMTWIFARVINLFAIKRRPFTSSVPVPAANDSILQLWDEMQQWKARRPLSLQPLLEIQNTADKAFPTIVLGSPSALCGNMFYHCAAILLLDTGLIMMSAENSAYELDPMWHALRIGGISSTTGDHANWVNNLQPLYIAAQHFEHPIQQVSTLRHLKDIEKTTGWKTSQRASQLRERWGLG